MANTRAIGWAVAAAGLAAIALAAWWSTRAEDPKEKSAQAASAAAGSPKPRRIVRRQGPAAPGESLGLVEPTDRAAFDLLPEAHRPDAYERALADLPDWLASTHAAAGAEFLGLDCAAPPCLVGVRYDDAGIPEADRWSFVTSTQAEVQRRLGFDMASMSVETDLQGREFLWFWTLPDLEGDAALRDEWMTGADARRSGHMAGLVAPLVEAEPQGGEPGAVAPD